MTSSHGICSLSSEIPQLRTSFLIHIVQLDLNMKNRKSQNEKSGSSDLASFFWFKSFLAFWPPSLPPFLDLELRAMSYQLLLIAFQPPSLIALQPVVPMYFESKHA
jgi:hypothetical protein